VIQTATHDVDAPLWAALLSTSALYFFTTNDADPDLWGHLLFGRQILASGAVPRLDFYAYTTAGLPWVDHEWLAQTILAAVYDWGGSAGLLLLKLLVGSATVALVIGPVRSRTRDPWVWGGTGLFTIAVLARGFAFRPQMFTYLGAAAVLAIIDRAQRGQPRTLWVLPPLFALWANLHGGFMLGLGIVAVFAAGQTLVERRPLWTTWAAAAASLAATALNPYGPQIIWYVGKELGRSHPITEWQPAALSDAGLFAFFTMLTMFVTSLPFARDWQTRGWQAALAAIAAGLALRNQRHAPVFAVCAAAPLAAQLQNALAWVQVRRFISFSRGTHIVLRGALVAFALTQTVLTANRLWVDGMNIVYDPADYPTSAIRALQRIGTSVRLAVPLEWGEYALWFLAPRMQVSLDGRFATLFSAQVVDENFDFFAGGDGWQRLIDNYPTDAALIPADSSCPIATLEGWQLIYNSPVAQVYARVGSAAWPELQRMADPADIAPGSGVFP
jgi:hypothetical protein